MADLEDPLMAVAEDLIPGPSGLEVLTLNKPELRHHSQLHNPHQLVGRQCLGRNRQLPKMLGLARAHQVPVVHLELQEKLVLMVTTECLELKVNKEKEVILDKQQPVLLGHLDLQVTVLQEHLGLKANPVPEVTMV